MSLCALTSHPLPLTKEPPPAPSSRKPCDRGISRAGPAKSFLPFGYSVKAVARISSSEGPATGGSSHTVCDVPPA